MDETNGVFQSEDTIFNNDPLHMMTLIGKKVQVNLVDDKTYIGIVYVIDPVYKNVIIHEDSSDLQVVTRIILHHAIKSLAVLSDIQIESYTNKSVITKAEDDLDMLKEKKAFLKEKLEHMCLHVEESGDCLKIDDNLVIVPPYGPENCICNNTLILERIQNIIVSMPL